MAEEKKRGKKEQKIDFIVNEMEEIPQASKTEIKKRART
jgi:hypothetical protein